MCIRDRKDETCSFYVTSAEEGEGKSTVAANLAVQLSDMEKKVLLVDLNTRNPRLGSMFLHSVDYSRTLNALYKGETDPLAAVISLTGYLDLLPSVLERNAIPMDGQVFDFIRGLEKDYDYVIIDTCLLYTSMCIRDRRRELPIMRNCCRRWLYRLLH